ncbi:MAG: hypothetical protein ACRDZ5_07885, partial [Acidimicrobiales bacterium]
MSAETPISTDVPAVLDGAVLDGVRSRAAACIAAASSIAQLDEADRQALGKRSAFAGLYQRIRQLAPDERRRAGEALVGLR